MAWVRVHIQTLKIPEHVLGNDTPPMQPRKVTRKKQTVTRSTKKSAKLPPEDLGAGGMMQDDMCV